MDRTTNPATFQCSQSLEQAGGPAGPGVARNQSAPCQAGDFGNQVFNADTTLMGPATLAAKRCSEKGCVFPAARPDSEFCVHHRRQESEPELFRSWQPTWLVIHRSTGPDGTASPRSRAHDRFRLAAQSKAFRQGIL